MRRLNGRVSVPLWSIGVLFVISIGISVVAYFAAVHSAQASQATAQRQEQEQEAADNHQWCGALELLTSKPVPKPADASANPSRAGEYTLYEDFVALERHYGC